MALHVPRWELIARARRMRARPTPAEARCRDLLEAQFGRSGFRCQWVIEPYIVDFWFDPEKVVIEVDGPVHDSSNAEDYDRRREDYLQRAGYFVFRVRNEDVLDRGDAVMEDIAALLTARRRLQGVTFPGRRSFAARVA